MNGDRTNSAAGLKRRLRTCVDRVANWTGVTGTMERRMRRGATVLMYHRILPDEHCADYPFASLAIPESVFAEQVHWLAQHCSVVTMAEALELLHERATGEESELPLVALTFDDGYRDNFEIAAPILEDAGVRATFFVAVQPVLAQTLLWYDIAAVAWMAGEVPPDALNGMAAVRRSEPDPCDYHAMGDWIESLKRMEPERRRRITDMLTTAVAPLPTANRFAVMSPEQVRELSCRGHEIGSHTMTHPILPLLGASEVREELARSRATLEDWTGATVAGFCYPNGELNSDITEQVRATGYTYACTTQPGLLETQGDVLRIPRLDITPQRVCDANGQHDELAFRNELCQLREALR